jgi:two-component system response regulator DevR
MDNDVRSEGGAAEEAPHLTRREKEVLVLVLEGRSSKEAGEALGLSARTIEYHLSNIYKKLGVSNKLQAFREAGRLGILVPGNGFLFSDL